MGEAEPKSITSFLTADPKMLDLLRLVERIAPSDVTTLILGESGTGKEIIARRLHEQSLRKDQSFVALNCGAFQESLLLSELFGHEKGAFTGALHEKKGLVELADKGTLFLDEIGELGLQTQAKLLRFLQEGEFYRVGGKHPIQVDVRVISATHKDLEKLVHSKLFREDLYYRINTVTLRLTPLRERPTDIRILLEYFLSKRSTNAPYEFDPSAADILKRYPWPGNVRELQNLVERLTVLIDSGLITRDDLPSQLVEAVEPLALWTDPASLLLESVERTHILRVLKHFKGNKTQAARAMGITIKTLYNKLALYQETAADKH